MTMTTMSSLIDVLSGALTMAFLVAAGFLLRFWRRTTDRLFLHFAIAFVLFAANQIVVVMNGISDERRGYAYVLRVLGYVIILVAILDKNLSRRAPRS